MHLTLIVPMWVILGQGSVHSNDRHGSHADTNTDLRSKIHMQTLTRTSRQAEKWDGMQAKKRKNLIVHLTLASEHSLCVWHRGGLLCSLLFSGVGHRQRGRVCLAVFLCVSGRSGLLCFCVCLVGGEGTCHCQADGTVPSEKWKCSPSLSTFSPLSLSPFLSFI